MNLKKDLKSTPNVLDDDSPATQGLPQNTSITGLTFTIIVPIYNESESLPRLVDELNNYLRVTPIKTNILFVNDGSTDSSQEIIEKVCSGNPDFHFIKFHDNQGLSAALKAGIDHCHTDLVGYIDADLQTTPLDFIQLLEFIPEYDLVTGIRVKRNDSIIKRITSFIGNSVRRLLIHDGIEDTGCPLKVMKASHAKAVPFFIGMHRFIPALFLMVGGKVKQVPVQHFPRLAGEPKFTLMNRAVKPLIDTLAFRWMMKRYIHYQIDKEA